MSLIKQISIVMLITGAALSAADAPAGVPKGATETSPGVYRFVDKDGKAWLYQKTPFGMSRRAEKEAQDPKKQPDGKSQHSVMTPFGKVDVQPKDSSTRGRSEAVANTAVKTKVTEDGDTIHFERPTPFGMSRWSRKKSELTDEEKRLWEDQRPNAAGNDSK
jgi:hypothetical protein